MESYEAVGVGAVVIGGLEAFDAVIFAPQPCFAGPQQVAFLGKQFRRRAQVVTDDVLQLPIHLLRGGAQRAGVIEVAGGLNHRAASRRHRLDHRVAVPQIGGGRARLLARGAGFRHPPPESSTK